MADVTKCDNKECPKKNQCYRFISKDDQYQSWADFRQICTEKNNYKWFYELRNYNQW